MVLDWDDALPEDDLEASEAHASNAQLALCLGTSLQVRPANSLPLRTVKAGEMGIPCISSASYLTWHMHARLLRRTAKRGSKLMAHGNHGARVGS